MRPKGVTKGVVADLNAPQPELIDLRRRDRPTLASFTSAPRRAGFFFVGPPGTLAYGGLINRPAVSAFGQTGH